MSASGPSGPLVVLCFAVRYFSSILVFNHLDREERAGCLA